MLDWSNEKVFDEKHSFKRIFKVIPDKQVKTLNLKWILPGSGHFNKSKNSKYLSHILGHEGPNSLTSLLFKEGLAHALSAGANGRLNCAFDEFSLTISLTEQGETDYLKVIEFVYMFINQIKKEGPQQYVFDEMATKSTLSFDNISK